MRNRPFDVRHVPGFAAIAIAGFIVLYVPMLVLSAYSFNSGDTIGQWEGFSLRWYFAAFQNDDIQRAALLSVWVATIAGVIATASATAAALATSRGAGFRGQTLVMVVVNQPLMVPEIVMAVALLILFAGIKVATGYTGGAYLIAAHTAFCIPFAYMPIRARLDSMDHNLENAAADLYAGPWTAFRRVTLPLLWPGILAGFMLAFVISLDDVVISEFVKSAGQETLPTYMLGQLRRGVSADVYAVSTLLLAISIAIVAVFFTINKSGRTG